MTVSTIVVSLCSGLVASALTLFVSWYRTTQSTKQRLKNCAFLLLIEVNQHRYWISHLDAFTKELLLQSKDEEWNHTKFFLAEALGCSHFLKLATHYNSKQALCKLLQQKYAIPDEMLLKYKNAVADAYLLLYDLAEMDETKYPHDQV